MNDLIKLIPSDAGWKIAGWLFTAAITMTTLLYKGIWKRINQLSEDVEDATTNLNRLIGAHEANHPNQKKWDSIDRRKTKREESD